jgi:hypothetical protein
MHIFDVDVKVLHNDQPAAFDPPWYLCLRPKCGVDDWGMPIPQCCSYTLWISFTSQALLYTAKSCRHTHTSFKNECVLSCTFCAQKLDDALLCLIGQICDSSPLCRHYSEQSAYDICPSWSVVTTVGRHKNDQPYNTENLTIRVVCLFYNKHYIFVVVHTTKWAKHSNNEPVLQKNIQIFHKEFADEECNFTASTELLRCWEKLYRVRKLNIWGKYYWNFQNHFWNLENNFTMI